MNNKGRDLSFELTKEDPWLKWCEEIPHIPFKSTWQVQVIPPFGGAIARFKVRSTINYNTSASVYLDCYDRLGSFGNPYWEVYPIAGEVARCHMTDVESLVKYISEALDE